MPWGRFTHQKSFKENIVRAYSVIIVLIKTQLHNLVQLADLVWVVVGIVHIPSDQRKVGVRLSGYNKDFVDVLVQREEQQALVL